MRVQSAAPPPAGQAGEGRSSLQQMGLSRETFLQLLVAQLRYQDPLSQGGEREFIAQLAQFAALEQMSETARWSRLTSGVQFIGKEVSALLPDGREQTGTVTGYRLEGGTPLLLLGEERIPLEHVVQVRTVAAPSN